MCPKLILLIILLLSCQSFGQFTKPLQTVVLPFDDLIIERSPKDNQSWVLRPNAVQFLKKAKSSGLNFTFLSGLGLRETYDFAAHIKWDDGQGSVIQMDKAYKFLLLSTLDALGPQKSADERPEFALSLINSYSPQPTHSRQTINGEFSDGRALVLSDDGTTLFVGAGKIAFVDNPHAFNVGNDRDNLGRLSVFLDEVDRGLESDFRKAYEEFLKEDQLNVARVGALILNDKFIPYTYDFEIKTENNRKIAAGCLIHDERWVHDSHFSKKATQEIALSDCLSKATLTYRWSLNEETKAVEACERWTTDNIFIDKNRDLSQCLAETKDIKFYRNFSGDKKCFSFTHNFYLIGPADEDKCTKNDNVVFYSDTKSWVPFEGFEGMEGLDLPTLLYQVSGGIAADLKTTALNASLYHSLNPLTLARAVVKRVLKIDNKKYTGPGNFSWRDKTKIHLAFHIGDLDSILTKGFLNQHQMGQGHTGGCPCIARRAAAENKIVQLDLADQVDSTDAFTLRPKYAYLDIDSITGESLERLAHYGGLVAVISDNVKDRATWSSTDSLDAEGTVEIHSFDLHINRDQVRGSIYFEAQIWGPLTIQDVDYFLVNCFPPAVGQTAIDKIKKTGRPVYECKLVKNRFVQGPQL